MNFICDNCGKIFSVKGEEAGRLMSNVPERVCSPKCAVELISKNRG